MQKCFSICFYSKILSLSGINQEVYEIKFVHASIWQYFVAERLYYIIRSFNEYKCQEKIMNELSEIFILNKKLDNMILLFLDYFMIRDSWKANNVDDYINLLINVSDYAFIQSGDKFE